jgi:hypothetical protein
MKINTTRSAYPLLGNVEQNNVSPKKAQLEQRERVATERIQSCKMLHTLRIPALSSCNNEPSQIITAEVLYAYQFYGVSHTLKY